MQLQLLFLHLSFRRSLRRPKNGGFLAVVVTGNTGFFIKIVGKSVKRNIYIYIYGLKNSLVCLSVTSGNFKLTSRKIQ
jgi:hypothetical protein